MARLHPREHRLQKHGDYRRGPAGFLNVTARRSTPKEEHDGAQPAEVCVRLQTRKKALLRQIIQLIIDQIIVQQISPCFHPICPCYEKNRLKVESRHTGAAAGRRLTNGNQEATG